MYFLRLEYDVVSGRETTGQKGNNGAVPDYCPSFGRWGANGNFIAAHPPLRFSWTTGGAFTRRELDELTSIALDAGCRLGPRIADEVYQRRSHGDNFEVAREDQP
jgi:hypothetical protein